MARACPRSARGRGIPAASATPASRGSAAAQASITCWMTFRSSSRPRTITSCSISIERRHRRPRAGQLAHQPGQLARRHRQAGISAGRRLPSRIPFHLRLPFRLVLAQTPGTYGTEASQPPSRTSTSTALTREKPHPCHIVAVITAQSHIVAVVPGGLAARGPKLRWRWCGTTWSVVRLSSLAGRPGCGGSARSPGRCTGRGSRAGRPGRTGCCSWTARARARPARCARRGSRGSGSDRGDGRHSFLSSVSLFSLPGQELCVQ